MRLRLLSAVVILFSVASARAESAAPRDIWPQACQAADAGDLNAAVAKTNELLKTGENYGIKTYPLYASSAASMARLADSQSNKDVAAWAAKAADQLDPASPAVAFSNADRFAAKKDYGRALPSALRGYANVLGNYRWRLMANGDTIIVLALAIALTAAIFAVALFFRYGRSMGHDFRELVSTRWHGGSVSVLAFALLFLPIFLWLGPMWLVFYWFIIFFGYATVGERVFIVVLALLVAALPLVLDYTSTRISGVDSPVVMSAIASQDQSYQPEALRRMQELIAVVPDNASLQLLVGNLQLQEGNEQQAQVHYRRAVELNDSSGAHVNLGNLHFLDNDFAAAITEYEKAEQLDPKMAIAFYNHSVASGETYKFEEQGQKIEQAKKVDRGLVERLLSKPPQQKVVIYTPSLAEAWQISQAIARRGVASSLFGNYAFFDPEASVVNAMTIGALLAVALAIILWLKRRRAGFAGSCIKCGRTFCHRCKSARESATYCTQCIHIYLKRDGVSLDTKRSKLDEVHDFHTGISRRNRLFATFLPGSAQVLEGRTVRGVIGMFVFLFFVSMAVLVGRLAPALGPVAGTAKLLVRIAAILVAALIWFALSLPVYRRKISTG